MNALPVFLANLYFLCAKLARWCAVLIALGSVAYGMLATNLDREFAGLSAAEWYLIGFIGSIVLFAVSALSIAAGKFLRRSVADLKHARRAVVAHGQTRISDKMCFMTYRTYLRWPGQRVSDKTVTEDLAVAELAYGQLLARPDLIDKPVSAVFTQDGKQLRFHDFRGVGKD